MSDPNTYWQAVVERDTDYDREFVVAVRTTGIYCRPSCPARTPLRKNVEFFALPAAAEQAGYRPCKRCHPREVDARAPQAEMVQQVCDYIAAHLDDSLTLESLGEIVHTNPTHLQRVFKTLMGITPRQYTDACRMETFRQTLRDGAPVTDAVYAAGYSSTSRLYERTDDALGMTPTHYREGGDGIAIAYSLADSPMGRLLVAATKRGISMVSLGDDDSTLVHALHAEFPAATITRDDDTLGEWVQAVVAYLNGWQPHLELPLDVRATAFQQRVWEELRRIPYGQTRTYGQVARALGQPTAARAVARACATNPAALVIPCHRVVRSDGGLGGYRWDIQRKRALLDLEGAE